jgi:hypothetical protein
MLAVQYNGGTCHAYIVIQGIRNRLVTSELVVTFIHVGCSGVYFVRSSFVASSAWQLCWLTASYLCDSSMWLRSGGMVRHHRDSCGQILFCYHPASWGVWLWRLLLLPAAVTQVHMKAQQLGLFGMTGVLA